MEQMDKRKSKVKSDYGINDYYLHYKSIYDNLDGKTFKKILREFNAGVCDILCTPNYSYKIPNKLGVITTTKTKNYVKFKDGKIVTNLPVNYKATNELWATDKEAKKNKTLIRHENRHSNRFTFKFYYNKRVANFRNKSLYKITINRELKRKLSKLICSGDFDTSTISLYEK